MPDENWQHSQISESKGCGIVDNYGFKLKISVWINVYQRISDWAISILYANTLAGENGVRWVFNLGFLSRMRSVSEFKQTIYDMLLNL